MESVIFANTHFFFVVARLLVRSFVSLFSQASSNHLSGWGYYSGYCVLYNFSPHQIPIQCAKVPWFCVSRLIEHIKMYCITRDIDTPSHNNVTLFFLNCIASLIVVQYLSNCFGRLNYTPDSLDVFVQAKEFQRQRNILT